MNLSNVYKVKAPWDSRAWWMQGTAEAEGSRVLEAGEAGAGCPAAGPGVPGRVVRGPGAPQTE